MDYQQFKMEVVTALKDFYGNDASVILDDISGNGHIKFESLSISFNDSNNGIAPLIHMEGFFYHFSQGKITVEECVGAIVDLREKLK
jgi:hypothetical protein